MSSPPDINCCFPLRSFKLSAPSSPPANQTHAADAASASTKSPNSMPAPVQLSLLARARRRRQIRHLLEHVARIIASPRVDSDDAGLALFSDTHCAILTHAGELIVARTASTRPFSSLAPKLRAARAAATSVAATLGNPPPDVLHVRGKAGVVHAYVLGPHMLVAVTEVSPGARNLDAVIQRVDNALRVGEEGPSLLAQLDAILGEF